MLAKRLQATRAPLATFACGNRHRESYADSQIPAGLLSGFLGLSQLLVRPVGESRLSPTGRGRLVLPKVVGRGEFRLRRGCLAIGQYFPSRICGLRRGPSTYRFRFDNVVSPQKHLGSRELLVGGERCRQPFGIGYAPARLL